MPRRHRILVENGRAVGVEYFAKGQMREARAEQEVIVASGAIGSPKLLAALRHRSADELTRFGVEPVHDLPGVGKNLQDHIDVYSIHELNGPHSYDKHTRPTRCYGRGWNIMLFKSGPVTSNLAEAGGFWYADPDEREPRHSVPLSSGRRPRSGRAAGPERLWLHHQFLPPEAAVARLGYAPEQLIRSERR